MKCGLLKRGRAETRRDLVPYVPAAEAAIQIDSLSLYLPTQLRQNLEGPEAFNLSMFRMQVGFYGEEPPAGENVGAIAARQVITKILMGYQVFKHSCSFQRISSLHLPPGAGPRGHQ